MKNIYVHYSYSLNTEEFTNEYFFMLLITRIGSVSIYVDISHAALDKKSISVQFTDTLHQLI